MHEEFEAYLVRKKIDSQAFRAAEPGLWEAWRKDFEQMHPNSFTVQKLNLINPVRRKYTLKEHAGTTTAAPGEISGQVPASAPKPGKPVMRPRPKMN